MLIAITAFTFLVNDIDNIGFFLTNGYEQTI